MRKLFTVLIILAMSLGMIMSAWAQPLESDDGQLNSEENSVLLYSSISELQDAVDAAYTRKENARNAVNEAQAALDNAKTAIPTLQAAYDAALAAETPYQEAYNTVKAAYDVLALNEENARNAYSTAETTYNNYMDGIDWETVVVDPILLMEVLDEADRLQQCVTTARSEWQSQSAIAQSYYSENVFPAESALNTAKANTEACAAAIDTNNNVTIVNAETTLNAAKDEYFDAVVAYNDAVDALEAARNNGSEEPTTEEPTTQEETTTIPEEPTTEEPTTEEPTTQEETTTIPEEPTTEEPTTEEPTTEEPTTEEPTIPVESITLSKTTVQAGMNVAFTLTATVLPAEADQEVIWSSSNESLARVDENGLVTPIERGSVVITATSKDGSIAATCNVSITFNDILNLSNAYKNAINWAADEEIVNGIGNGQFGASQLCTRKQFVIMIWRLRGKPAVSGSLSYTDCSYSRSSDSYKAILWASRNGIVSGYSDGTFRPEATVTKQQTMIMLYRYMGRPAVSGSLSFRDVTAKPSSDTYKAILWGINNGLAGGSSATIYSPNDTFNRARVVLCLYKLAGR